jgi:hypothetical protein
MTPTELGWAAVRPVARAREIKRRGRLSLAFCCAAAIAMSCMMCVATADARTPLTLQLHGFALDDAPGWALSAVAYPTNFSPTQATAPSVSGTIAIHVLNIGSVAAGCTAGQYQREESLSQPLCPFEPAGAEKLSDPITVTDHLPSGVRAVEAGELASLGTQEGTSPTIGHERWSCTGNGSGPAPKVTGATVVTCVNKVGKLTEEEAALEDIPGGGGAPAYAVPGVPNLNPIIGISVDVQPGAAEHETNVATIAGGGAPAPAESTGPVTISAAKPPYELTHWTAWFSNEDGTIDEQAGSHPYVAYFDFGLATEFNQAKERAQVSGGEIRTAEIALPQGFVGDPTAAPQCSRQLFGAEECPSETMIGTTMAYFANLPPLAVPVFNLVPPEGVPAEFGFSLQGLNTYLDASVRTGSDNGVTEHVSSLAHKEITQAITTIWGVPGNGTHNRWRAKKVGGCSQEELESVEGQCNVAFRTPEKPLLTLPTDCGSQLPFVMRTTSWTGTTTERAFYMHNQDESPLTLSGCGMLTFNPTLAVTPELSTADSPTGLSVDVTPTVAGLQQTHGLSGADIRNAKVSLPKGFVVNPGEAASLQSCSEAAAALTSAAETAAGQENSSAPSCPLTSKVGTATAKSPILEGAAEKELQGNVYLLPSNPPDLKLLAALSGDGVNVKLVLDAKLNEETGQIVTTVENAPELPVSDFALTFAGGERASVDTPARCGTYATNALFSPWTSPEGLDVSDEVLMGISAGPGGSACPDGQLPFSSSLVAGMTGTQAGGFGTFSVVLSRSDGQQRIGSLRFRAPAGIAALISSVPLCEEPQAAAGSCGAGSLIGHATVVAGPGASPLVIPQPGDPAPEIFLTGPYEGAPFGLSIVTRALAGPFDLGTIVTRARIEVDPHTAQVTVTTDALPQMIKGVPTDIRVINAVVDRAGFMFNPTNCTPAAFTGSSQGAPAPDTSEGASTAPVQSAFGTTGCRALSFGPRFVAGTSGRTSKADGASLKVDVTAPAQGPQHGASEEANIGTARVELPKALPSRLTTLQKACTAAQFDANPAGCPAASRVGMAVARSPVLNGPLVGPAYFVSHGGEAFPQLVVVLQGEGVVVDLVGDTFISKAGITSSTFKEVPDVPVSSFELTLPQGPYSALAANGNLCQQALVMPTTFTAQNGATTKQSTQVEVEGCPGALAITKHTVKGRTATVTVYVPGAGKLTVTGKGLKATASKAVKGRGTIVVKLSQKKTGKLRTTVAATFTPSTGKARRKQVKTVHLTFKR